MDDHRFDALSRILSVSPTRRAALWAFASLGLFGSALDDALAKKKGKGNKKGKGKDKKKDKDKEDNHCTDVGLACTFSVHPCCDNTLCCDDPSGHDLHVCLPADECCKGNECSGSDDRDCGWGCTCQDRNELGIGTCQAKP